MSSEPDATLTPAERECVEAGELLRTDPAKALLDLPEVPVRRPRSPGLLPPLPDLTDLYAGTLPDQD